MIPKEEQSLWNCVCVVFNMYCNILYSKNLHAYLTEFLQFEKISHLANCEQNQT